jgi:nitroreductase
MITSIDYEARFEAFASLVRERHSCRAFKPDPVPRNKIVQLLELAQSTPSDCNIQPWKTTVVGGSALEALRNAMYERASSGAAPVADISPIASYSGVYQERRRACGWTLYETLGIERGDRAASGKQALENFRFFGAPHLVLITTHASLGARGMLDCGGYVTNLLLAAQALGIATVPQASIAYRADVLRDQLQIPEDDLIVCGVSLGWADRDHLANSYRMSRASIDEVVRFVD